MKITNGDIVCLKDGCYLKVTTIQDAGILRGRKVTLGNIHSETLHFGESFTTSVDNVVVNLSETVLD